MYGSSISTWTAHTYWTKSIYLELCVVACLAESSWRSQEIDVNENARRASRTVLCFRTQQIHPRSQERFEFTCICSVCSACRRHHSEERWFGLRSGGAPSMSRVFFHVYLPRVQYSRRQHSEERWVGLRSEGAPLMSRVFFVYDLNFRCIFSLY